MENIYEILSDNLVRLRKSKKITQAELANILKYSDKTVSKWENGEAMPTLETLVRISEYYEVSVDDLLKKSIDTEEYKQVEQIKTTNKVSIALFGIASVLTLCVVIFIASYIIDSPNKNDAWTSFIWFTVASSMLGVMFSFMWTRKHIYLMFSFLLWTSLTAIYLQFLVSSDGQMNYWMLFILGAPVQAIIILTKNLRKGNIEKVIKKRQEKEEAKKISKEGTK